MYFQLNMEYSIEQENLVEVLPSMLMHHIVDEDNILLHFSSAVTDNDILSARARTHTRTLQKVLASCSTMEC
jgi:hypothetical protein